MTGLRLGLLAFRLPLRVPLVTGRATIGHRAGFLVALADGEYTGWGEAAPLPGWSSESLMATGADLARARLEVAESGEPALTRVVGSLAPSPSARAGLAGAWADLRARRRGRSLAEDLAPGPVSSVVVNALVAVTDPAEVQTAAAAAVEAGYVSLKLKVGASDPVTDIERVRAVRSAIGAGPELRLDANGAWDRPTALEVLGAIEPLDVSYCEEPVPGIDAMADLSRACPVPIAVDESLRTRADADRALGSGLTTLVVKPQALGGPDIAMEVIARAAAAGARVVITSFVDSAVGLAHGLHVAAAAVPGEAHGLATSRLLATDVAEPPTLVAGRMGVPSGPGLGVEPDDATLGW